MYNASQKKLQSADPESGSGITENWGHFLALV